MKQTRRVLVALAIAITVAACGGFKESLEDTTRATAALKSELGIDAQISFRTVNGHTSVGVRLSDPPVGDAATVKAKISEVVNRTFRAKVEHVEVSF